MCAAFQRRFVAGLGVGALSAIVPLYNGEAAPKKIRGAMLVLYQLQIIMGYASPNLRMIKISVHTAYPTCFLGIQTVPELCH